MDGDDNPRGRGRRLRQKLASESIMSDERGTGMAPAALRLRASDDDDIISDSPTLTLPERPKVDNMFRSFSLLPSNLSV